MNKEVVAFFLFSVLHESILSEEAFTLKHVGYTTIAYLDSVQIYKNSVYVEKGLFGFSAAPQPILQACFVNFTTIAA